MSEMAPDHAIVCYYLHDFFCLLLTRLKPESAYDNLNDDAMDTDVPPDVTIEVIDDDPSEDEGGRACATNVYVSSCTV